MEQHEAVLEKFAFSNALCLSGGTLNQISTALSPNCLLSVTSLFYSKAGNMGGVAGQLCRVNSVNSRGENLEHSK